MKVTIPLQILDIDEVSVDYCLLSTEVDCDTLKWESEDDNEKSGIDYGLSFCFNKHNKTISNMRIGGYIQNSETEIKELFFDALLHLEIAEKTDIADGLEYTDDTSNSRAIKEYNPYDPKLIRVDTKPLSVEYVCKLIRLKRIDLSPDFQRGFVWNEITRKSRLIESIMLRIPLPVFYLSQDEEGTYQVVDGIQRLTVINDFLNNRFKLKNLEYLTDSNDRWFRKEDRDPEQSISSMYASRIEDTQLFFNIIDPSTPEQVKYDIFRRINTGGKTLNSQEIRNCLSNKKTRDLLKNMIELDSFKRATKSSISSTRMADKELVLRFIGFYIIDSKISPQVEYKGDMNDFLDHINSFLNVASEEIHKRIIHSFDTAMENAFLLFGDTAFRKTTQINKALFLSWSRSLYTVDTNILKQKIIDKDARQLLKIKIETIKEYSDSISRATNDIDSISDAFKYARLILKELLDE